MKRTAIKTGSLFASVSVLLSLAVSLSPTVLAEGMEADSNAVVELKEGSAVTQPVKPADPNDPGNIGTGKEGTLVIDYASNFNFGSQEIKNDDNANYYALNSDPYIQITDLRGEQRGWRLLASLSQSFQNENGEEKLKGASLTLLNPSVNTVGENLSQEPTAQEVSLIDSAPQTVMIASKDAGRSTWWVEYAGEENHNQNVILSVPRGQAKKGITYTATIQWELLDGPG